MKTSLTHLPEDKQQELQRVVDIIRETIVSSDLSLDMLILFGSYARGDWVEDLDPDTLQYRYQSDYDLMIVTETRKQATAFEQNSALISKLNKTIHRTPISLIAEDIKFVNKRLRKSQYFYIDIKREGIMLVDSGKFELAEPIEIHPNERVVQAQDDFDYWFKSGSEFMDDYTNNNEKGRYSKAAFYLHQATECFYNAIQLVFTRYKPKTHDLGKLAQRVASAEPKFLTAFPQGTEQEQARFELLRKAYVDARYKPSYSITPVELEWLAERVLCLQELTERLCKEKIGSFG
ncbi:MAG: HEPN domain-containing protein/predicted nucleotidyltransferase [Phenylobacterium sp.]|jgi:HEPN domain-containing protein/predicted nucleotidyltransferase